MSSGKEYGHSKLNVFLQGLEGAALIIVCTVFWPALRYLVRNLGTTQEQRDKEWPGDALLDQSDRTFTRSVKIEAAPENIWPWIVQIGREKAGFYSYELIENLAGFRVTNRDIILPEFQTLREGEFIPFHPNGQGVYAGIVKPREFIVFKDWKDEREIEGKNPASKGTWSLYIEKVGELKSQLVIRSRKESLRPDFLYVIVTILFIEPIDFVMEYKMMRVIKRLAEDLERA